MELLPEESRKEGGLVLLHKGEVIRVPKGKVLTFLKDTPILFKGKEVIPDFYSPLRFQIEVEGNRGIVSCLLPKRSFLLEEASWLGFAVTPLILFKGILYTSTPLLAEKFLKKEILDLSENDLEELRLEGDEEEISVKITSHFSPSLVCTPILRLTDRSGGFGNLFLDYQGREVDFEDPIQANRNLKEELGWEKDLLETGFIEKRVGKSRYHCPLNQVYRSLHFLLELGWTIYDFEGKKLHPISSTSFSLSVEQAGIHLRGKISFSSHDKPLEELVGAFNRKEKFLKLSPTDSALLPPLEDLDWGDLIEESHRVVEGGVLFSKMKIGLFQDRPEINGTILSGSDLIARDKLPPPSLSPRFKGTLRPYQALGVSWLQNLYQSKFSALLADEMGLGKTVQILAFLSSLDVENPILIIVPTSLLFNWQQEIFKFIPDYPHRVYHGLERNLKNLAKGECIITSFGLLDELEALCFSVIVVDEAHLVKNEETKRAQALMSLSAPFKISITGTPVENKIEELYTHFQFLLPGLLGKKETFLTEAEAIKTDRRYLDRIKKKIFPFILRRKKGEVAQDLPPISHQVLYVDLLPDQREIYDDFLRRSRSLIFEKISAGGISKHRMEIFEIILRLRQLACHPLLFTGCHEITNPGSGKLEMVLQDIQTILEGGKKALVYSQFTSFLALIKAKLDEAKIKYAYLDGSTQNRSQPVEAFQKDPSISLFLMSLKAGGVGLNLTEADYVLILDPWWNEAVEEQAIGRAHRIGRTKTVFAKRYISRETIEEKMMSIKERKQQLGQDLLDDTQLGLNWNLDELEELLS